MKPYRNILVALELEPESDESVLKRADIIRKECPGVVLWLIHAVEQFSTYGFAYGVAAGMDVSTILKTEAEQLMRQAAKKMGLPEKQCFIVQGPAKYAILEEAKTCKADLIIVGSHGRHGVQLLLGSTSNAILHSAHCDVLAVRISV